MDRRMVNHTSEEYSQNMNNMCVQMKFQTPLEGLVRSLRIFWLMRSTRRKSKNKGENSK